MNRSYDLFNPYPNEDIKPEKLVPSISGMRYLPNFISEEEEKVLIKSITESDWMSDLKRRVQHYGWRYDYKVRNLDYSMRLGDLPTWAEKISQRLFKEQLTDVITDQVIVNEYKPGQGITNHVDCEPCFGNSIVSLSLASSCIMNFVNLNTKEKHEILLEPRSIIVIKDEARYNWSHGVPARLADTIDGNYCKRDLRYSMTFRKVVVSNY